MAAFAPLATVAGQATPTAATLPVQQTASPRNGQADFDFHLGTWKTHLRRLLRPLTGSTTWAEYEGTTVPTIGEFKNGRGEFHAPETLNGRGIFVRFTIVPITPDSIRFEQFFSDDGGRTWELNWVAIDTRVKASRR